MDKKIEFGYKLKYGSLIGAAQVIDELDAKLKAHPEITFCEDYDDQEREDVSYFAIGLTSDQQIGNREWGDWKHGDIEVIEEEQWEYSIRMKLGFMFFGSVERYTESRLMFLELADNKNKLIEVVRKGTTE